MAVAEGDRFLTNHELAARYNVAVQTVRHWRFTGTGPPGMRIGGLVRYREADVLSWERERAQAERERAEGQVAS